MSSSLASSAPSSPREVLEPCPRRWTREEYDRMGELGWFRGQRTELIEGEIMVLSPQGPDHSYFTDHVATVLRDSGWPGVWVRMQLPMDFGPGSEPEPDVSVVEGPSAAYRAGHPKHALLIVEISDSTLAYDRTRKASLYALHGVADYWVVNIPEGQLEVRRGPRPDAGQPFGFGYGSVEVHQPGAVVSPLAVPQVAIRVSDLLG
jgi:Uma2 family endonuclease